MAQQLRRTSLLGSVGMLRVLGGVFRELRAGDNPAELNDITEFFKRLDPHMTAPVTETSIWLTTDAGDDFEPNASARSCGRRTSSTWWASSPGGKRKPLLSSN